jgi:hypothetical protein
LSVYGVKLHLLCTTNGSPYPATHPLQNVADLFLSEEPTSVAKLGEGVARRLSWGI